MTIPLRVLIVEDREDDALLLLRELAHGGYAPTHERVDTGQAMAAALAEPWDIILSDYTMPHFSAPTALELLKRCGHDIPFIIVSGNIGEEAVVEAMHSGASDCVMKDRLVRLNVVVERELREAGQRRKRKQAEQALCASEALLNEAQRIARLGSWELDLVQNDLKWSDEVYRIFELDPAQFDPSYETFLDTIHPDDRDFVNRTYTESVQTRIPYDIVHRLRMKDGRVKYVHERCETFYDGQGRPLSSLGTVQDVTERKQAEEALFQEKERAQVTLQSIGDAVITTDAEARVDYMNPVAEQLTGWSVAEARGQPLARVFNAIHELTREPVECLAALVLREQRSAALDCDAALIRRDGVEFSIEDSAAPIRDRQGAITGVVLVFHDVSQARVMANQIVYQARHDPLTGLLNRREFELCLKQALESAREDGKQHAVCYIDLDQFKVVNDTCGHMAGDELLKQLAGRLQERVRGNDILARLGGDEFGVLLHGCPLDKAWEIADDLCAMARKFRFAWEGKTFDVGASIGLVPIHGESASLAEVLSAADSACYVAKSEGRNRVHVYQADDRALARHRSEMQWVSQIRQALEEDRFCLYYQVMQPLNNTATAGNHIEVLLRMKAHDGQLVLPMAFIGAAERYNLMTTLDRWVIRATFDFLSRQSGSGNGNDYPLVTCAINLSGQSLCEDAFLDFAIEQLQRADIQPTQICFEITETAAVTHLSRAMRFISTLKGMGCRFALDDFGSGLSSFGYLKNLPVDYLKIDGTFVRDMADNVIDRAMVEAINNIGHVMHIQTIAEWVEDDAVLALAQQMGIDFAQGYAIAKPQPLWGLLQSPPAAAREGENSSVIR
ncbi:MAG: EAL domain-containing protein [Gammaproteobacteria bacterium]|nr:EAL domain-containing protein [Gammaproteobacteria bacterium]